MRAAFLAATILAAAPAAALAGDTASRTLIGFSPDGSAFAFMESGVQDGSGFPYASVYFVDIAADAWAAPPVEVRLEAEAEIGAEGAAVLQAMRAAWPALERLGVSTPARLLWSHPLTEAATGDPEEHGGWPGSVAADFTDGRNGSFTLLLDETEAPDGDCAQYDADIKGFALTLRVNDSNTSERIYADDEVPDSRVCPLGYSLSDVLEGPARADGGRSLVVVVNVFRLGFEGWDRRFIAIPFAPPAPEIPARR
jgi:predicted secreted protein